MNNKIEYTVTGLSCPSCAGKIETELNRMPEIKTAVLNFASQSLKMDLNTGASLSLMETKKIIDSIESGVAINPITGSAGARVNIPVKKLIRFISAGLIFSLALVLPLLFNFPRQYRLVLLMVSYLISGGDVIIRATGNIIKGRIFDENFLMTIATMGAWGIGEAPEAVAVMLFYQLGELFQETAVNRSRRSIQALTNLRPDFARVIRDGREVRISPDDVEPGEKIILRPGERTPLDSRIISGESFIDNSAISGESVPVRVAQGNEVYCGSINVEGVLTLEVLRNYENSAVARIMDLVEKASERKADPEKFITRFARYYTPAVFFSALALGVIPSLIQGGNWSEWLYRALVFLVVSCPCALVVSVPLSFFAGLGAASKAGLLIKGGNYLDILARAETVVFDKTGTLTRGDFRLNRIEPAGETSQNELLLLAASAESGSNHPIARALLSAALEKEIEPGEVSQFREIRGKGITAEYAGEPLIAGSGIFLGENGIPPAKPLSGGTEIHIALGGEYRGYLTIEDSIKDEAGPAVEGLKTLGINKTILLTGDSPASAERVRKALGINEASAALLPYQKVEEVEKLEDALDGRKTLLFIGDGINDAPVIARADAGIAMGALGSDAAIEAADIVVMDDNPARIADGIIIARRTRRIVIQNIILALGIKTAVLLLGALGIASLWTAVFADVGVTLLAVLNTLRISEHRKS